jgi:hypothetical protein
VSDPMKVWNDWFKLSVQATQLAWKAQNVIALRLMRMAAGGQRGHSEAQTMITEKIVAAVEAQVAGAAAACAGGDGHRVTKKVIGVYKKRVRGTTRRLTRSR